MARKAYLYMRFSSAEQAKGDSLARQRALAEEYIARYPEKEIELDDRLQFVDEGVSSYGGQNLQPGRALHRFLECVEDGTVSSGSILMVESLDRLSRQQVLQSQRLLLDILLSGISVITTSPTEMREYDGRSGLQDLIISIAGMERANQESAIKSDRVRRAWKRKKENASSKKLTKRAPSWLRLSEDRTSFEIIEDKAAVVRRIFDLAEAVGQTAIVRILNAEGIEPLVKSAGAWHQSSVAKVLSSLAVIGMYQPQEHIKSGGRSRRVPDGPVIENYYPKIIDKDAFYRVQSIRTARKAVGAGRKGRGYANIFGGIAKCKTCGSSMVIVDKGLPPKGGRYLVCSSAMRGAGCEYRSVRYQVIESAFLLYCQHVDVSDLLPGGGGKAEASKLRKREGAIKGEIDQKRGVIQRLLGSIEANGGEMPKAVQGQILAYERQIDELERDLLDVATKLGALESESHQRSGMRSGFNELLIKLRGASGDELYTLRSRLHALLRLAISRIEVGRAECSVRGDVENMVKESIDRMGALHPAMSEKCAAAGLSYPSLSHDLTVFSVVYKNGNLYELFLDTGTAVAGRMTYAAGSASAKQKMGSSGLQLVHGYPMPQPVRTIPRAENGKFRRRALGELA